MSDGSEIHLCVVRSKGKLFLTIFISASDRARRFRALADHTCCVLGQDTKFISVPFTESGHRKEVIRDDGIVTLQPATISDFTDWLPFYDVAHNLAASIIYRG